MPDSPTSTYNNDTDFSTNNFLGDTDAYDPSLDDEDYVGNSVDECDDLLTEQSNDYKDLFPNNSPNNVRSEGALLGYESDYSLPRRAKNHQHPDRYLPQYTVSDSEQEYDDEEDQADLMARDDRLNEALYRGQYPMDTLGGYMSTTSVLDDVSVGGSSTNISSSELARLCEIEDSEANMSEEDQV